MGAARREAWVAKGERLKQAIIRHVERWMAHEDAIDRIMGRIDECEAELCYVAGILGESGQGGDGGAAEELLPLVTRRIASLREALEHAEAVEQWLAARVRPPSGRSGGSGGT